MVNDMGGDKPYGFREAELAITVSYFSLRELARAKLGQLATSGYFEGSIGEAQRAVVGGVEAELYDAVLRRFKGNQVHAARALGVNRNTLRKKVKLYQLEKRDWKVNDDRQQEHQEAEAVHP